MGCTWSLLYLAKEPVPGSHVTSTRIYYQIGRQTGRQAEMDSAHSLRGSPSRTRERKNDEKRHIRRKTGDPFLVLFTDIRRTRSAFSGLRQQFEQFRLRVGGHDSNGYQRSKYYSDKQWVWQIRQREHNTNSQQFQ